MSTTLNHVHRTRNAAQRRNCEHVPPVQARGTLNGTPLNDGVRASYSIESELTIGAIIVAVFGAGISVGLVFGIGLLKTFGAR